MPELCNNYQNVETQAENALSNLSALLEAKVPFQVQSKTVIRIDTEQGAVMYYPRANKWQHRGRCHMGDSRSFVDWVKRLKPKPH